MVAFILLIVWMHCYTSKWTGMTWSRLHHLCELVVSAVALHILLNLVLIILSSMCSFLSGLPEFTQANPQTISWSFRFIYYARWVDTKLHLWDPNGTFELLVCLTPCYISRMWSSLLPQFVVGQSSAANSQATLESDSCGSAHCNLRTSLLKTQPSGDLVVVLFLP